MKYIILIGDGMADRPLKSLRGKTCLQKARTPNMDWLAFHGQVGVVRTIPRGMDPGSDVANLSILGYNPLKFYSGRAPVEAVYRGIRLNDNDVAFRCNLVTLDLASSGQRDKAVMLDYSAGHITSKEAAKLIRFIQKQLGSREITFYPGVSYRHLMVWKKGRDRIRCTPPHDITGKKIGSYLPIGKGSEILDVLMKQSTDILIDHPVNRERVREGLRPANSIWFWGQGKKLSLPDFRKKYGLNGVLISAVDLTKGLGISAGFDVLNVRGATGYTDTNYRGKANAALRALKDVDIAYVHVEAPDEAGHSGDIMAKIQAIEDFDSQVVGTVMKGMKAFSDYRIMVLPDHFTPISVRTHTSERVPYVIFSSSDRGRSSSVRRKPAVTAYSEAICRRRNVRVIERGYKLMEYFIKGKF